MKLESKLEVGQLAFFIDDDIIKMGVVQTVNYEKNEFWYKIALGVYGTHDEWEEGVFATIDDLLDDLKQRALSRLKIKSFNFLTNPAIRRRCKEYLEKIGQESIEPKLLNKVKPQIKKWKAKDFFNTKIHVDTPEKSKAMQELLFDLGFRWEGSDNPIVLCLDRPYLFIWHDKTFSYGYDLSWKMNDRREIFFDDIFPITSVEPNQLNQSRDVRVIFKDNVRILNILKSLDVSTIDDMANVYDDELKCTRGVGKKIYKEIIKACSNHNVPLKFGRKPL